jgi:hypothetical protein
MEEKSNDYQLSFLHNILKRPVSRPIEKKEVIPLNDYSPKSVSFRISSVNSVQIVGFENFDSMFF